MTRKVKAKEVKVTRRGRTSTSRISSQHQVTLPVDILRAIGLKAGDKVKFEIKDGAAVITPEELDDHPLRLLIGAGGGIYDNFDLAKRTRDYVATVVLDTSVLIALFKEDDRHHRSAVKATAAKNEYLISSITLSEALVAAFRLNQGEGNRHNLLIRKSMDRIVPIEDAIAVRAAEIRAEKNLSLPDALISATAHLLKAQLWSCDQALVKAHKGAVRI